MTIALLWNHRLLFLSGPNLNPTNVLLLLKVGHSGLPGRMGPTLEGGGVDNEDS